MQRFLRTDGTFGCNYQEIVRSDNGYGLSLVKLPSGDWEAAVIFWQGKGTEDWELAQSLPRAGLARIIFALRKEGAHFDPYGILRGDSSDESLEELAKYAVHLESLPPLEEILEEKEKEECDEVE